MPDSSASKDPRKPGETASPPAAAHPQLPSLDISDSLPQAAQIPSADYVDVIYTQQPPEQRAHSRDLEKIKEAHKQRMEIVYLVGTLVVLAVTAGAFLVLFFKTPNPDVQKIIVGSMVSVFTCTLKPLV